METGVTGASEGKLKVIAAKSRNSKPSALKLRESGRGREYGPSKDGL